MIGFKTYKDREDWLAHRTGIGASEISSVLGRGFSSPTALWMEKTGQKKHEDLSGNERVSFGNRIEQPLRELFSAMYGAEYRISFTPYKIYRNSEFPYIFYTPDGELEEIETGRKGLYESKSAFCYYKKDWDRWDEQIPDGYFDQICQGMYCGGFEFAVVFAILMHQDGDATIRKYKFERSEVEWHIKEILEAARKFRKSIKTGKPPAVSIEI